MDTVWGGESGANGEGSIGTCTLLGVRWMLGETLLCSTGNSVWGSVMTWRERMGEGREGIYG